MEFNNENFIIDLVSFVVNYFDMNDYFIKLNVIHN